jgi:hypothetical protein
MGSNNDFEHRRIFHDEPNNLGMSTGDVYKELIKAFEKVLNKYADDYWDEDHIQDIYEDYVKFFKGVINE